MHSEWLAATGSGCRPAGGEVDQEATRYRFCTALWLWMHLSGDGSRTLCAVEMLVQDTGESRAARSVP